ncbi:hypothetical protein MLP_30660 [Microlunatus phosphovorus NM-1]|uniref:Iminophenyl-pyruvate dimer synthase domain-containing protein n=1 Tax=Microlunatus phosphovorus (strain ATCC 700054 / DSM 10555 / JCM 9379 / NBRC 101784 / NCIMB 13414 / VKM Ac-1990 / NM-1) TaxID=1032480 RepID=F5XKK8_MICPN|nr:hypothetical protein MLP_30660 [Microlunatus phosphovorus NM-1]
MTGRQATVRIDVDDWDMSHMQTHLQAAADLEAWTIPFYLSAMFSICNQDDDAYKLIQSVANQEMLHLQLVGNIANAFGYSPEIRPEAFAYQGTTVPHLDFSLDPSNPAKDFTPYSAEIGPLDEQRINAMCLIEYPEWDTGGEPDLRDDVSEYGSIGEFYDALMHGAKQLKSQIKGGVNQVYWFGQFYPKMPPMQVDDDGTTGFEEVEVLMEVIRDQGEAAKAFDEIAAPFRNTYDDPEPAASHYQKFVSIRNSGLPETYSVKDPSAYTPDDLVCRQKLIDDFAGFTGQITDLLAGRAQELPLMEIVGQDILACWQSGVTPQFTKTSDARSQLGPQQPA